MGVDMDPLDPASFNHRTERLSTNKTYHFVDQLPSNYDPSTTATILCVHGFPDLWYGWRYQIGPWTRAGYRVVAPDMLGYGRTDKPKNAAEYSTKNLCADLAALLDLIHVRKAVVIGHDWGAATVWRFALYYPERLHALVTLSIPYIPPAPIYIPPAEMAERVPNLGYQVYFGDERSTKEIEANLGNFMALVFKRPGRGKPWAQIGKLQEIVLHDRKPTTLDEGLLSQQEHNYYVTEYSQGGMRGPLSYYRTNKVRFEEEKDAKLPSDLSPSFPVLFIWGSADPTCTPQHVRRSNKFIKNQREERLEGKGHWLMVEGKDVVVEKVLGFLGDVLLQQARAVSKL